MTIPRRSRLAVSLLVPAVLAACHGGSDPAGSAGLPGDASHAAWAGVKEDETLYFLSTEPFWGGEVRGGTLTWTTPEDPKGTAIAVSRFAGRGGMALSGTLAGKPFEMAVSEARCSDGMSDSDYPFTVTVKLDGATLRGCGWSETRPRAGPEHP